MARPEAGPRARDVEVTPQVQAEPAPAESQGRHLELEAAPGRDLELEAGPPGRDLVAEAGSRGRDVEVEAVADVAARVEPLVEAPVAEAPVAGAGSLAAQAVAAASSALPPSSTDRSG